MSTPTAPLAALTTIFTPPCATSWLLTTTKVPSQYPPFPTTGPSSCDPPSWQANIEDRGFQYYSPAICPNGFEVGPNCQITKTRTAEGFPPVVNGETAVYCVPSGHTCTTDTTDFRGGVWGFTRATATSTAGSVIVTVGPALQIRFRDEDLSALETHPLTPGLILAGAATSTDFSSTSLTFTSTSTAGFSTITRQATASTSGNTILSDSPKSNTNADAAASTLVVSSVDISGSQSVTLETKATETTSSTQGGGQSMNPGSLAAIVLSSILIVIVLVISSVFFMRRNRRNQVNRSARLLRLRRNPWVGRDGAATAAARSSVSTVTSIVLPMQRAELPDAAPVLPELAPNTPFGAKENPAELHGQGLSAELNGGERGSSTTWSWMSRASKQWSARSMRSRSSIGRSSFRWTRSAASMQTASSGRYSGDWENFARGKWGSGGLGLPAVPVERPLPEVPKTPGSARLHVASHLRPDYDLNRLSRISDGTFGAPGKSPVSIRFNRS